MGWLYPSLFGGPCLLWSKSAKQLGVKASPVLVPSAEMRERLLANIALVGPLARVYSHVLCAIAALRKRSVAHVTREWPLAHVNSPNVSGEMAVLCEGLFAETALERPLTVVHPLVPVELEGCRELLAAHITFVPIGRPLPLHANMHMSHVFG